MKRFTLLIILSLLFAGFVANSPLLFAMQGQVILTANERLFVARGETITVNMGQKDGILKGDILRILKKTGPIKNKVGECVVTATSYTQSVCEIKKAALEVERGDIVLGDHIAWFDERIGPLTISLLKEILDPYGPEKRLSLYLSGIFDKENRLTSFSRIVAREIENVISKKKRLRLVQRDEAEKLRDLISYPDRYFKIGTDSFYLEEVQELRKTMERVNLDVVLMGTYEIQGGNIVLSMYYVDKDFGEKKIVGRFPLENYLGQVNDVIEPFRPLKAKIFQPTKVSYKRRHFFPSSYEQRNIALQEADRDVDFRYTILERKIRFNRISPENITLTVDQRPLKISENEELSVYLEEGSHTVSASFYPAFYQGSELVYLSKRKIEKQISLTIKEPSEKPVLHIDVIFDLTSGNGNILFNVYRKLEVAPRSIRPIELRKGEKEDMAIYSD